MIGGRALIAGIWRKIGVTIQDWCKESNYKRKKIRKRKSLYWDTYKRIESGIATYF